MFAISYRGEVIEDTVYETWEEAKRAIAKEVLDACREDALYGSYSKRREAGYWSALRVIKLYPFSAKKHIHDLSFRSNKAANESARIRYNNGDEAVAERLDALKNRLDAIICKAAGGVPTIWLTGEEYHLFLFDFYKQLYKQEEEFFFSAFIQKHRLFGDLKDGEEPQKQSLEENMRMSTLMDGMREETPVKRLQGGYSEQ